VVEVVAGDAGDTGDDGYARAANFVVFEGTGARSE